MPESAATLVAFLLFVTPGLAFELMRERRRGGREHSTFRETAVVVVASVVFSTASCIALYFLATRLEPGWLPDAKRFQADPLGYFRGKLFLLVRTLIAEVALALLIAWLVHRAIRALTSDGLVLEHSAWYELTLGRFNPKDHKVWAEITLDDGSGICGYMHSNSVSPARQLTEVVLRQGGDGTPITLRLPDGPPRDLTDWHFYVIPAASIHRAAISYVAGTDAARLTRRRRAVAWFRKKVPHQIQRPPPADPT